MVTRKEDQKEETARLADEELNLDRERARDPLRPLVLVLLQQAREQMREREEREEGPEDGLLEAIEERP